ncbi:hybrid sensor histidine kinase/response regulator [Caenimonas soli]|uniref:hybrid sensor histidine kinase/response regulator n=1 Tax=Caenimonas soli TaxID=2735555 RepID=UPI00155622EF|nr:response regulator [Caenimonas soli]NPC58157.1 response regulator [Caenimonas soli]
MNAKEQDFLRQLRATFTVEAQEHLQAISTGLMELEKTRVPESQRRIVETVFRAAHSLKGAARAVELPSVESRCQSLEEVLASWKRGDTVFSPGALDHLHRLLDAVTKAMASTATPAPPPPSVPAPAPMIVAASAMPVAAEKPAAGEETVRVAVAKLEARLLQAEEMLSVKLAASQRVADFLEVTDRLGAWRKAWAAVEPEARRLRQPGLERLLDFFDWSGENLKSMESRTTALGQIADQDRYSVTKLIDDSLEDTKKLLLLPFATISAPLPKLVRDLSRDEGKEAELVVRGEEVELDKRILEEIKDPLIHLLRNSIDHGIESPAERSLRGKPPRATIALTVTQLSAGKVQVLLSDDGAGIDAGKVRASAVALGLIAADEAGRLSESETQALIFQSDVSTSPIITQLSGRGLGLAIVREKAERLGGEVTVESRAGQGAAFRMVLPATRATFRGVLLQAAGQLLIVPTTQAERVTRARIDDIRTVEGRETVSFEGRALALTRLADVLQVPRTGKGEAPSDTFPVIILGSGDQRVAFAVDAVLDEQEVLVKPLVKPLSRVRNIAGATVLGSGQVALILNVADLLKSARKLAGSAVRVIEQPKLAQAKAVLVAEDSITSRMLIKGILESAGYRVRTAVDGLDAFALLRSEQFDLVVSDVEMPRLNGFDLTARIRADRKMAELPVVLVTALEARQDRERGIDVGANAYLVKSSFDQSNLLEAVGRLI